MKTETILKWADLSVQTLILTLTPLTLLVGGTTDPPALLMITGLYLGPWQMFSCATSILATSSFRKEKIIHLAVAAAYLLALMLFANQLKKIADELLLVLTLFLVPAGLGLYYYTITWRWARKPADNGKFLRHISF